MGFFNARVCAVCGKSEIESRKQTEAFVALLPRLVAAGARLKRADSWFAHPSCIEKARKKLK